MFFLVEFKSRVQAYNQTKPVSVLCYGDAVPWYHLASISDLTSVAQQPRMAEGSKRLQTFGGWDWIEYHLGTEAKEQNMEVVRWHQKAQNALKEGLRKEHELVRSKEAVQEEVHGRKNELSALDNLFILRRKELIELQLAKTPAPKQIMQLPSITSRLSDPSPLASLFQPLHCSSPLKLQTEVTTKMKEDVQVVSFCFQPLPAAPRRGILKTSRTAPKLELQWGGGSRSKRSRSEEEVEVVNGDGVQVQSGSWGLVRQGVEEQAMQRQDMEQRRKEELEQLQTRRRMEQLWGEQQPAKKREEELEQQQREERMQQGMVRLEGQQSIRKEIDQEIARRRQVEHEVNRRMRVEQERVIEEQRSREDQEKQALEKAEQIRKEGEKQDEMIKREKLERERARQQEEVVQRVRQVKFLLDQEEEVKIVSPDINRKQEMNLSEVEKLKSTCQLSPFSRLAVLHSQSRREVARCALEHYRSGTPKYLL